MTDKKYNFNKILSSTLMYGVIFSGILIVFGIFLYLIKNDYYITDVVSIKHIIRGLFYFDSYSYLMIGIFILILTPIIRIISMLLKFISQKNYIYINISIIVLLILMISLIIGVTH